MACLRILPLMLLGIVPVAAFAHSAPPPADLARGPAAEDPAEKWHLLFGQAFTDTVTATDAAARLASVTALASDHWEFEPLDRAGHLTSEWKPIHHLLFRMFSGKAFGRVFVDVTPVTPERSAIRFQGVLATSRDIQHNPARGWAEHAYASAVHVWEQEMHGDLAHLAATGKIDP